MPEVLMPRLSDATAEATIVAWLVPDGSRVRAGEEIVEIEFDKATTAWPVDADGVLSIAVPAGRTVRPGTAIARIGEAARTEGVGGVGPADAGTRTVAADRSRPAGDTPEALGVDGPSASGDATSAEARPASISAGPVATPTSDAPDTTSATVTTPTSDAPDTTSAAPTTAVPRKTTAPGASPATPGPAPAGPGGPDAPVLRSPTRIERLVSDRMVQSRTEIPEFTVSVDVDMTRALGLRGDLKAVGAPGGGGRTPSVNDLLVKACGLALVDHPRIRSAWTDEGIVEHARIDVGIAVATDDGGLVVPVLRAADRTGLAALAATSRELTGRARRGRITPQEMDGATFSISNLGAMGVASFTAIIGPGQGAILAVGATTDRVVPVDGAPAVRPVCTVTLSCDHRVIYGAHAAAFLERLRSILEHPGALAF